MKSEVKFIDLFAGIGGLRLGFEQACIVATEISKIGVHTFQ